jgi:hypothetical protein
VGNRLLDASIVLCQLSGLRAGEAGVDRLPDKTRRLAAVSEQHHEPKGSTWSARTIDELARSQGAQVVDDANDLFEEIWESDEELDAFLADLRASRDASPA